MRIDFAYYTNKGHVRQNNQDALFLDGFGVFGDMKTPLIGYIAESEKAFFSVVDGAGGHARGEIASQTIVGEFIKRVDSFRPDGSTLSSDFIEIQNLMTGMSKKNSELSGMSAALSGASLHSGEITAFNVGDCRTYKMHRGFLKKLTHDHSIVQILRDNDEIDDDEMRTHPAKNRITSVLMADSEEVPAVYIDRVKMGANEILLICSDGVWESLPLEAVENALSPANIDEMAESLFDALMASECQDNISFILIKTRVEECS